jgi:osmotically-inducible protein OsmY
MRDDVEIQHAVDAELCARQRDEPSNVSAVVRRGVVRLSGFTGTYHEKYAAETAIRAIAGVTDVINDIETHLVTSTHPSDAALRCEVMRALQTEVPSLCERLTVEVHNGEVTLKGSAGCYFLRERAESAVWRLGSIVTVHNAITLDPEALAT